MDAAAYALEREALRPIAWTSQWQRFFLIATGILSATIVLKISAIQWLEFLYLVQIGLLLLYFIRDDLRSVWFRPYLVLAALYLVFMVASMALAFASLRFTFYAPAGYPWFIGPIYITISRVVEFFASTFILLSLADLFRQEPAKLRLIMRIYFWTGVASTIYSYISYPIDLAGGPEMGSYSALHRFRGFYNEGGPYGLYLLTVIFVGLALYHLRWDNVVRMRVGLALLPVAFYKSYSKAAFFALLTLLLINGLFTRGLGKRVVLLGGIALIVVIGVREVNLTEAYAIINADPSGYERASHQHVNDGNYVLGRVAARFIIPRMIAAHPLTGIGWGNYGFLRNDPTYRGASVWSDLVDQPALGILGYAAELGLPLLTFLSLTLLLPYFYLRFRRMPTWMTNLALLSPLVHLYGAQLNVTYPWICTAFALALGYAGTAQQKLQTGEQSLQLSWNSATPELEAGTAT